LRARTAFLSNGGEAAVEVKVDSGGSREVEAAVKAEVDSGGGPARPRQLSRSRPVDVVTCVPIST
jgi:hypothetical protein